LSDFVDEEQFEQLFGDDQGELIDEHEAELRQMISDAELENLNIDDEVFAQLPSEMQMEILMRLKQLKKSQSRVNIRRISDVELVRRCLFSRSLRTFMV
jgi:hypothetical protein